MTMPDGATRPMIPAHLLRQDGTLYSEAFLIDTGADITVLSAAVLQQLNCPTAPPPAGLSLVGISGSGAFVLVQAVLEFRRADGGAARVRGSVAAFVDPAASDYSILGRDVLDNFDVIISRRQNEIWLLAPHHGYRVIGP
jgi:hypothetical protein